MAISTNGAKFLGRAISHGVMMRELVTVGRLGLYAPKGYLNEVLATAGRKERFELSAGDPGFPETGEWADELYSRLGATSVRVLDGSNYEGADLVHNLNTPLPKTHREKFDCLIDGGTLEHVFNVPEAIKSYMNLVRVGGHMLLLDMPATNCCGHGFYQFSPAFFWQVLSPANGFELIDMIVCETKPFARFWKVQNPAELRRRVELIHDEPCHLYVAARKIAPTPDPLVMPIQDDYAESWAKPTPAGQSEASSRSVGAWVRRWAMRTLPMRYWSFSNARNAMRQRRSMILRPGQNGRHPYLSI